ncbi:hypothetical protein HHI36_023565 [Cryptolaemus montrouzieri]|uniref:Uncharacterized protein n=1 Tax=Cryptolaemus montrouzieri TaxID=559131 RepID=A0ABD2PGU0_9CUCU
MSDPDVEEIVTYISTKLNKIFYDREFVSCVANDFQKLKSKNIKCCVLVFPALGPIYQRALKYQAKAFDLATFGLSGGTFKTIAVCQKEYLLNENKQEIPEEKEKMSSESLSRDASTRKKRPERQLYVPPAQRKLAQSKDVKENKSEIKSYKVSITPLANEVPRSKITLPDSKVKKQTERTQRENRYAAESNIFLDGTQCSKRRGSKVQCEVSNEPENATIILKDNVEEVNSEKVYESILFLSDLMHLNFLPLSKYSCNVSHKIDDNTLSLKNFHECSCEFHQFLISRCENILGYFIPIYRPNDVNLLKVLINNYFCWQPLSTENLIIIDEIIENNCAIPFLII